MHQTLPGTNGTAAGAGGTSGCDVNPNYSGYNTIYPWTTQPPYQTTTPYIWSTTTTTSDDYSMNENEVNIEKVDNGYIVTTKDKTLVATCIMDVATLLRQKFEKEENT